MYKFDKRVLIVSFARAVEMFSLSFLVVVLPLFIAGEYISINQLLHITLFGIQITEEFLIGIALSTSILISSLGQPIIGRLSDKIKNRKLFIIIGFSLLLISTPFYLTIESYFGVLVLRFVQGIAGAISVPAAAALVNDYSIESNNYGENFGFYNTFRLLGFGIGPLIAGIIIERGPYNVYSYSLSGIDASFYFVIFSVFIALSLVLLFIKEPEQNINKTQNNTDLKDIIHTKQFKTILILSFATFWLASSINIFATLEVQVNNRFAQGATWFGIQFSAALLANTVTQIPIGSIVDKYNTKPFIVLGFIILIPSITFQGFATTSEQILILRIIQGLSVSIVYIPTISYTGELGGSDSGGLFLSVLSSSFALGLAVGPLLSGILFTIGGFSLPFVFAGVFSTIGLLIIITSMPKNDL